MKIFLLTAALFLTIQLKAQVDLSSLADCTEVRRISNIESNIKRPILTLNTLYSADNYQKGYDVEYVLNHLSSMSTSINSIFKDANIDIELPSVTSDIDDNTRILQHRAFRTLLTFLRSRNGQDGVIISDINHSLVFDMTQLTNFLTALKRPSSYFLVSENNSSGITDDYVKWAQSLANYARAIDLYLAFEIAVDALPTNLRIAIIAQYGRERDGL